MKDKIFGILQRVGRSFMLPIAVLPVAGLLLGVGASFTNTTTIAQYGLEWLLGSGTILNSLLIIMSKVGSAIFDNLPLIFAVGVAIGMAKREKEVSALSAVIAFFVMNVSINAMLVITGQILSDGTISPDIMEGTISSIVGINTLQMGVFGGIIVGLGVSALHNKFYRIELPSALSFFGGTRFIPIISTIVYTIVGIILFFTWPIVQNGIYALGSLVTGSGYAGTFAFGIIKRGLIPFGLHHVFYLPFWQTAVGGTMEVAGVLVEGGQNIFFAQLADPSVLRYSADATRYFSGEFIFMIFGLPGAALAMYRTAKPEKKKIAGGLLLSAALTSMLTGITEPMEFSFLFVAPMLFGVQVLLAGSAYMIAHILNIAVGVTFSGGLLDLFLFGILQGNAKTGWLMILVAGVVYFALYYFIFKFLIEKFNLKTPGREDDSKETKLYTKKDVAEKTTKGSGDVEEQTLLILEGLGGHENISDLDSCATRLRVTVIDADKVDEKILKVSGAAGVVKSGKAVQVVYGPQVSVIKSKIADFMENPVEVKKVVIEETVEEVLEVQAGKNEVIYAPITGEMKDMSETPDATFAQKMMGDGVVIFPSEGSVFAPFDGEVTFVFGTKHAIGLISDLGTEMLVHVGIDTVQLDGKGFEVFVNDGDKIKKGDILIKFDIDYLIENAPSLATPIVFTNLVDSTLNGIQFGKVVAGEEILTVE
ncbi:MAG: PTS transporter subunit EIIC [Erysipelothrix sp.]|nr:PTS transporter subunit EIIC [Erysipelothrix sp.]